MKVLLQRSKIKLLALVIMATALVTSCSKEKKVAPSIPKPNVEVGNDVSVDVLITYYANLIKADKQHVTYDEKADQFLFYGTAQNLTRKKLTEIYLNNTKTNK